MLVLLYFLSTLSTPMTTKTSNKTRLVDLGSVYDAVKDLADSVGMPVSTVARLIVRHTLSKGGSIGFVPQTQAQYISANIPYNTVPSYTAQGSLVPAGLRGNTEDAG